MTAATLTDGRLAYSMKEAAKLLSVHRATLYRLVERGELKLTKVGGRTVIQRQHLQAMLDAGENT